MFDKPYIYKSVGHTKSVSEPYLKLYRYTFKCRFNHSYIICVEEYERDIFIVKFHLKNHKNSDKKYNLLTKLNDASRIIATNVKVMMDIYEKNPLASFGFIGANIINTETEEEEQKVSTKRFKVYSRVMYNLISPLKFTHYEYPDESAYLLLNKANVLNFPQLKEELENLFRDIYIIPNSN